MDTFPTTRAQHHQAFGKHTGIPRRIRSEINKIKNNDPKLKDLEWDPFNSSVFSDIALRLLGRYITENLHLEYITISEDRLETGMTDSQMALFFGQLKRAPSSLKSLGLGEGRFSSNGIRSMVPFLVNSPHLSSISIYCNTHFNTECFRLVVGAMSGGSLKTLSFICCNIVDSTALEHTNLPQLENLDLSYNEMQTVPSLNSYTNLKVLNLSYNQIGAEGFRSIANFLQDDNSCLETLNINNNDIDSQGVLLLADSLTHNTTLVSLDLRYDSIDDEGCRAFSRLLNDISSIEATGNSNNTLRYLQIHLQGSTRFKWLDHIESLLHINRANIGCPTAAGRQKVIENQLDHDRRESFCLLQNMEYSSRSVLSHLDPILLPETLSLLGTNHPTEAYLRVVASAPILLSPDESQSCAVKCAGQVQENMDLDG